MERYVFVSYQMAEAIKELKNIKRRKKAQNKLNNLKKKWLLHDIIPGYGIRMKEIKGLQELTIDEVKMLEKSLKNQVQGYVTECNANLSYCMQKDKNGNINFDFRYANKIAKLAKENKKKIRVDSAVCFGDMIPMNMLELSVEQRREAIARYFQKLTDKKNGLGDVISKIDVLNSVFERGENEKFWIDTFGKDYAIEILKIARKNIKDDRIKLCWNEFYLTKDEQKRKKFIAEIYKIKAYEQVHNITLLDEVGVQDKFKRETGKDRIVYSLEELYTSICMQCGKKMSITEFSVAVGKDTIDQLKYAEKEGLLQETRQKISREINEIFESVEKFVIAHENIVSIESRCADKFDVNSKINGFDIPSCPYQNNCSLQRKIENKGLDFIKQLNEKVYHNSKDFETFLYQKEQKVKTQSKEIDLS